MGPFHLLAALLSQTAASADPGVASPVVGGAAVEAGRWDDAAVLLSGGLGYCSGTLIHPEWVLTAGHCLSGGPPDLVAIGTKNWFDPDQGERLEVEETFQYPASHATYDIGLVRLATSSVVPPRVLASDCVVATDLVDGASAWIVGFGATDEEGRTFQPLLNEALTTLDDADCSESLVDGDFASGCRGGAVNPGGELGAGGDGVDACFGDSGGPLYLDSPRGMFLAGVTSRSYLGVEPSLPCSSGGIWVRPDAVLEWIEDLTGPLPRPACNEAPVAVAEPIRVRGRRGLTEIQVVDADSSRFTFEVVEASSGEVEVLADGAVAYEAGRDFDGTDAIVVSVTDDGSRVWPDAAPAVSLVVIGVEAGSGCAVSGAVGGNGLAAWVLAAMLAPVVRRRGTIPAR